MGLCFSFYIALKARTLLSVLVALRSPFSIFYPHDEIFPCSRADTAHIRLLLEGEEFKRGKIIRFACFYTICDNFSQLQYRDFTIIYFRWVKEFI